MILARQLGEAPGYTTRITGKSEADKEGVENAFYRLRPPSCSLLVLYVIPSQADLVPRSSFEVELVAATPPG